MIRTTFFIILALVIGGRMLDYADGWQFKSAAPQRESAEYLMKHGVVQPDHAYILAPGQKPDAKLQLAALTVSCHAIRSCR